MRVLRDEIVPRKLSRELAGHTVSTVQREGWAGLTNGHLLDAIDSFFDVFLTMDKGMRHQLAAAILAASVSAFNHALPQLRRDALVRHMVEGRFPK